MTAVRTWLQLDLRRRWRSLAVLALSLRIERPVVLAGRRADQSRADEVEVSGAFLAGRGKKIGDTLTLVLSAPEQAESLGDTPVRRTATRQLVRIVGAVRSPWAIDAPGYKGGVQPTAAFFAKCRKYLIGATEQIPINALVRLRGGRADTPRFKTDLARVSGRSDIDIWNRADQLASIRGTTDFERSALLAFALAALALIAPVALLVVNLLAAWPGHRAARLRIGHVLRAE